MNPELIEKLMHTAERNCFIVRHAPCNTHIIIKIYDKNNEYHWEKAYNINDLYTIMEY